MTPYGLVLAVITVVALVWIAALILVARLKHVEVSRVPSQSVREVQGR